MRKSKPKTYLDIVAEKKDFREIAEASRGLAREIQNSSDRVSRDTLLIYVDKSGRLARVPVEEALRERGAKLPKKRYFLNFSVHDQFFKTPWSKNREIDEYLAKGFRKIGGHRQFRNIVIVDEHAAWGATLNKLKRRLEFATGKPVATVALGSVYKPAWYPDYSGKGERIEYLTDQMRLREKPVKDAKTKGRRPAVVAPVPNKEALFLYGRYVRAVKREFAKKESARKPAWREQMRRKLHRTR